MDTAASQSLDLMFQTANTMMNAQVSLAKVLLMTLDHIGNKLDDHSEVRILKKYLSQNKKGPDGLRVITCPPDQVKKISEELTRNGVINVNGSYTVKTRDQGGAYATPVGMILFRDVDEERANSVVEKMNAQELSPGLSSKAVINQESNGEMRKIKGLSLEEAMLYSEKAGQMGIHIAMEQPEENSYNVVYDAKHDRDAIERIKAAVAVDTMGISGEALKKQLRYEDQNIRRISDGILNNDLNKDGKPMHVVDYDGATLHVNGRNLQFEDQSADVKFNIPRPRKSDQAALQQFNAQVTATLTNMRGAVLMNDEQYQKYLNAQTRAERKKILRDAERQNGRPDYTKEEKEDLAQKEAKRSLYERKLMQDNPVQTAYQYSYTNDEMRMDEFNEYEKVNRDAEHDRSEGMNYKDPQFTNDAFAQNNDFDSAKDAYERYQDDDEEEQQVFANEEYAESVMEGIDREDEREAREDARFREAEDLNREASRLDTDGNWYHDDGPNGWRDEDEQDL